MTRQFGTKLIRVSLWTAHILEDIKEKLQKKEERKVTIDESIRYLIKK